MLASSHSLGIGAGWLGVMRRGSCIKCSFKIATGGTLEGFPSTLQAVPSNGEAGISLARKSAQACLGNVVPYRF